MRVTIEPTQDQSGRSPEATHCVVSVAHPADDLDINSAIDLMRSALIAWGFSERIVDELLGEE